MTPKRKRSRLGPTRYVARCNVRRGKTTCWKPLPKDQHTGICERCRDEFLKALRAFSA